MFYRRAKPKALANVVVLLLGLMAIILAGRLPYINLLFLIYGLIVVAASLPLPGRLNNLSARLLVSILISAAFFQLEGLLFLVLRLPINTTIYTLSLFIVAQLLFFFAVHGNATVWPILHRLRPGWADLAILSAAVIVCSVLLLGTFRFNGINRGSVIQSIGFGIDDGSHISMLGDEYRAGGKLLLPGNRSGQVTFPGFIAYPKGWHLVAAVFGIAASPNYGSAETVSHIVDIYFVAKILTLFLTITAFSLCIYVLMCLMRQVKGSWLLDSFLVAGFSLLVSVLLIVPSYWEGFFTFFPAVAYGLLFLVLFLVKGEVKNQKYLFVLMSLCVVGSALTWLLAAPALFLTLILALPTMPSPKLKLRWLINYIHINSVCLALAVVAFASILAQAAFQVFYNVIGISALTSLGGISKYPVALILTMLLGYVLFCALYNSVNMVSIFLRWLSPLFAMSVLLLLYQLLKMGNATYYFYKLEVILVIFAAVPAFGFVLLLITKVSSVNKRLPSIHTAVLFATLLSIIVVGTTNYKSLSSTLGRLAGHRYIQFPTAQVINSKSLRRSFADNNSRLFFVYPKEVDRGIIASHIARLSHPINSCEDNLFNEISVNAISAFIRDLRVCARRVPHQYIVYTDFETKQKIQDALRGSRSGKVISVFD